MDVNEPPIWVVSIVQAIIISLPFYTVIIIIKHDSNPPSSIKIILYEDVEIISIVHNIDCSIKRYRVVSLKII